MEPKELVHALLEPARLHKIILTGIISWILWWLLSYAYRMHWGPEAPVHYTCRRPEIQWEDDDWPNPSTIKVTQPMPTEALRIGGARVRKKQRPKKDEKEDEQAPNRIQVKGSAAIRCYDPGSGNYLGIVNPATNDGIDRAIERAAEAQKKWAQTTFSQRRKVLRTLLRHILLTKDCIVWVACKDSGKTKIDAMLGEVLVTVEKLQWTIDHGEDALKPEPRPTNLLMMYKENEVVWEPLGVVAACVSWNYPFHNFMGPVISALFAGNAIVVKGSEYTAWSQQYWCDIARGALKACGHSPNLVQSIVCWPSVAEHLTSHPGISHLTFIGSHPVAHHVAKSAAKSLTPLTLELGGKDPAIILDDALGDLDRITATLIRGVFQSAGQNCIGIERIIALPRVYSKLATTLPIFIRPLRTGHFTDSKVDIGACISDARFSHLESLIASAVKHGAHLLCGGTRYAHPRYPKAHFFTPTLLIDVTPSMAIATEELFAPIALLIRAPSIPDAIAIANATPYALGASVFGRSSADLDTVTKGVRAGMVAVNDFAAYYAVQLPFGGARGSGYGRFAGAEGLRGLCNMKAVCRDAWPFVKTSIPGQMRQPYDDGRVAYRMSRGIVNLGYGGVGAKVLGLLAVLGFGDDRDLKVWHRVFFWLGLLSVGAWVAMLVLASADMLTPVARYVGMGVADGFLR